MQPRVGNYFGAGRSSSRRAASNKTAIDCVEPGLTNARPEAIVRSFSANSLSDKRLLQNFFTGAQTGRGCGDAIARAMERDSGALMPPALAYLPSPDTSLLCPSHTCDTCMHAVTERDGHAHNSLLWKMYYVMISMC